MLGGAVAGAGIGWLWARRHDVGVPDDWMRSLADRLNAGEAAVVFEMSNVYPTHLVRELRRFDGRLLHNAVDETDTVAIDAALDESI